MKIHSILIACVVNFGLIVSVVADINSGLLAHYKFDGNANDSSGNGNHGTVSGVTFTPGKISQGANFDGIDDYISINVSIDGNNSFSICTWVKFNTFDTSYTDWQQIITNLDQRVYFGLDIDPVGFQISGSDSPTNLTVNVATDYHVCYLQNDSNQLLIYVNGSLAKTSGSNALKSFSSLTTIGQWVVGDSDSMNREALNGVLDDLRIYSRALSELEIQELYRASPICTDTNTDGSTAAGIAQCKANPASCGIDISGGAVTGETGTVSANLDIYMPSLNYTTLLGTQNIWVNLNFSHEESGKFYWTLKDYGSN